MRLVIVDLGSASIAGQRPSIILKAAILCRLVKQMLHCLMIGNKACDARRTGSFIFSVTAAFSWQITSMTSPTCATIARLGQAKFFML